jgi:cytochrome c biogenesis protein CcdA
MIGLGIFFVVVGIGALMLAIAMLVDARDAADVFVGVLMLAMSLVVIGFAIAGIVEYSHPNHEPCAHQYIERVERAMPQVVVTHDSVRVVCEDGPCDVTVRTAP